MEFANNQARVCAEASRYRRIRLPYACAELVFAIGERLGHTTAGQTIEWLLNEVKSVIDAVLESDSTPPPQPTSFQAYHPMAPPIVPYPPVINPIVNPNFVHPQGFVVEPENETTNYFYLPY
ncbi:hypothetical protein M9H77_28557 [Catharanthus roseus]|uniref:Uncharacterized protein n=1 Tax=Catharanthus roseus TaxID=4058 RepID=A0ACC0AGM9_CATRO|nr:hypothetical protein M9H77_28557 [Catharanthus roseus]